MSKRIKILALLLPLFAVTACGGGGGGGGGTPTEPDRATDQPDAPTASDKAFTVSLNSVDIRRVSNGEQIVVDTSAVNSGTLTFQ